MIKSATIEHSLRLLIGAGNNIADRSQGRRLDLDLTVGQ